ncbi:MAG: hypothetical protein ABI237_13735 [Ginsengibacter sp.]
MTEDRGPTYDFICFTNLAYEFDFAEKNEIEKKIKRRLKYYKIGDYNQDRIDYLRQLKNDLFPKISSGTKSKYFNKSKSNYADLSDFDRMTSDYVNKYDKVNETEMKDLINFAIYLYHIR